MKMKVAIVSLISLSLTLSACGQKPVETSIDPNGVEPPEVILIEEEDVENTEIETENQSDETVDVEVKETIEVIEQPIALDYYMNGIYDIKPKDDTIDKNIVLLTFDDGPKDEEMLTKMLDILDKHEAKAIFFVNGFRIEQNPELLELIHNRGQIIGNHSWDHISLKNESKEIINQQIDDLQTIVEDLTGEAPIFFRPPHGQGNEYLREKVKEEGMLYMTWSNGSEDWVKQYQYPEGVIQRVLEQLRAGSNILMHELPWTVEALDDLLTQIEEEGYGFVDPRAVDVNYVPE
ncbi:polysaccharide deacetylase family protein [Chengkuizengella axinellae]|uniref:Polysaccharide deacetylase family protein n=1 Tax=Chengkuizengella axinellae TaxID=3064388 RepID=A0ABT9IWQ8_9BACL|nr:polysaccharide deacetylase family protein [Chengkuizengella sp. 2205SS18-9]MDP5273770.1 polysaccharide deacetylase family protein [Chengkuizengella sp. 2205SS18-9]